jgi:hypothetical protein
MRNLQRGAGYRAELNFRVPHADWKAAACRYRVGLGHFRSSSNNGNRQSGLSGPKSSFTEVEPLIYRAAWAHHSGSPALRIPSIINLLVHAPMSAAFHPFGNSKLDSSSSMRETAFCTSASRPRIPGLRDRLVEALMLDERNPHGRKRHVK